MAAIDLRRRSAVVTPAQAGIQFDGTRVSPCAETTKEPCRSGRWPRSIYPHSHIPVQDFRYLRSRNASQINGRPSRMA